LEKKEISNRNHRLELDAPRIWQSNPASPANFLTKFGIAAGKRDNSMFVQTGPGGATPPPPKTQKN
jgi:hypothetical protein